MLYPAKEITIFVLAIKEDVDRVQKEPIDQITFTTVLSALRSCVQYAFPI